MNTARAAGVDSPTLYVFIPRKAKDELANAIAAAQAAEQTIAAKGAPGTPEGQLARQSMESRRVLATQQRDQLAKEIVSASKVYQGGASELLQLALDEKLESGVPKNRSSASSLASRMLILPHLPGRPLSNVLAMVQTIPSPR